MYTQAEVTKRVKRVTKKHGELFFLVILFGSFARKEQNEDSDIDILVLIDTSTTKLLTSDAYNAFHDELYDAFDQQMPIDLLVYGGTRDVNEVRKSQFFEQIQKDGIVLYDKRAKAV